MSWHHPAPFLLFPLLPQLLYPLFLFSGKSSWGGAGMVKPKGRGHIRDRAAKPKGSGQLSRVLGWSGKKRSQELWRRGQTKR